MKYYAGLDVSQQTTSICIVDDEGKIVAERKVASCPDAIAEALELFAIPVQDWKLVLCRSGYGMA